MNKVFKVIWSEARNAYVVVSEIAKNHGSKSCSTKKLLTMLIATGVMTCASMAPAMAATDVDSGANVTIKKGAKVTVVENATVTVGDNAIALGKGAYAVKNSIAIGNGAYTQDGSWTKGQSVALGNGAVTGAKSTSIGSNAIGGREGTITIGANANNGSLYATIIGTDSKVNYMTRNSGAAATIVGAKSEIKNDNKSYSGVANGIFGSANTIENSNGVTIQGSGNTVTNAYKNMSGWDFNLGGVYVKKDAGAVGVIGGMNTVSDQIYTNVIGFGNTVAGDADNISHDVFVAGSRNNLSKVSDSIVMGNDNEISDKSNVISLGHENNITANNAVAIGNGASVSAEGGVALGIGSVADRAAGEVGYDPATGKAYDIENGDAPDYVWQATSGAVSVGSGRDTRQITNVAAGTEDTDAVNVAQLKKVNEEALKHSTVTNGDNITVTEGLNKDGGKEYKVALNNDINLAGDNDYTYVNISGSNGSVWASSSVAAGNVIMDGTTATVSGLGNTTTAYDGFANGEGKAATEEQLKEISKVADNANQGWNLSTNGGEASKVAPGETVDFSGDKNITISNDGTKVQVELNKNLKDIETISNGGATLTLGAMGGMVSEFANGKGASVKLFRDTTTINNAVTVYKDGRIAGVAAGINDNDAVNVGQLKEAVEAGNTDTHIKAGEYGVGTDNKVNMQLVDKNGKDAGTVTIKDVAKASDVGDVNNIASDIKNKEGKTTVVDAVNNLNNKVGDLQYSKVEKGEIADGDSTTTAIGKLDQKLTDVAATAAKHTKVVNGSNITVEETAQDGQKTYKVGLNKDILLGDITGKNVSISGTNGTIETTGYIATKDRVYADKGAKLADVDITGDTISNDKSSVKLDKEGTVTINNKVTIDGNGKVSGVADGEISATSTDAVNGGQLYKTNQAIANNATNISSLSHSISNLDNRVNKVGAGAAALAALHPLDFDPDAKWDFAAGYGNYRGTNAAAVGAYYRPNEDTMFSVGGTFGNGENMVNAGVSFKLGSGSSHVSTSRVAMAKEIKELRGELEAMKSAMLDANAGKKIDTSKLQLFPDVPQNHWAYEYVTQLAGNGMIEGYPDGNFAGDRPMTRYEFAAILYRAMTKGAVLSDKILNEFSHELEYFTVDTVAKDKAGNPTIQRVRTVKANTNK